MERREIAREAARSAYELGRWQLAVAVAAPAPVLALLSAPLARDLASHLVIGVALAAVAVGLAWRGGAAARGVRPGLAAGAIALVAPTAASFLGIACWGSGCGSTPCLVGCVVGGVVAGVALGAAAPTRGEWLVGAGLVASLTGALGCMFVGAAGLVAMVGALAFSAPLVALGTAEAS